MYGPIGINGKFQSTRHVAVFAVPTQMPISHRHNDNMAIRGCFVKDSSCENLACDGCTVRHMFVTSAMQTGYSGVPRP